MASSQIQAGGMYPATYFTALIDPSGQIMAFEASGQRVIGVTLKTYDDLKAQRDSAISKAEELYKLCVDNGLIKPEPTQEEILKKAMDELEASRNMNAKLMKMLEEFSKKDDPNVSSAQTQQTVKQTRKQAVER